LNFQDGSSVTRFGTVCWFDSEKSLMKSYAEGSGMDLSRVVTPQFGLGNDMLYKLKQAIALDAFDLIVIDSIQAVIPDSISDIKGSRNMRDKLASSVMWAQFFQEIQGGFKIRDADGKLIRSKAPEYVYDDEEDESGRKRRGATEKQVFTVHRLGSKKCCLVFINHARTKIETGFSRGGSKTYTPGGEEKDYAFSLRLELKPRGNKMGKTKGERILKYKEVEFKSGKNKLGLPLRSHIFLLGIDGTLMVDDSDLHDIQTDVEGSGTEDENDALAALRERVSKRKKARDEDDEGTEDEE
jgi:RecA/RadA recombinase